MMIDVLSLQLEPHYQPIVSLKGNCVYGFESLIRCNHYEFHTPERLFKAATRQNKKQKLDLKCLEKGFKSAPEGTYIFLNINACTLASGASKCLFGNMDLSRVVVEITEHDRLERRRDFASIMDWLKSTGCKFAIDDISRGYDRLFNLVEYGADYIKMDRALIRNCHKHKRKQELLKYLVAIAKVYGAKTIAEGVETEEEYRVVKELGFDFGQGFYFARPCPSSDIPRLPMAKCACVC